MNTLRSLCCEICHQLYQRGYVVGHDGNVSVKVDSNRLLITPSGISKGRISPDMLVLCDLDGTILEGDRYPSSEIAMHLLVYQERPEIHAVVHAHPPVSTAFAIAGRPLSEPYLTETISGLGEIPVAPFAIPSTQEVPDSIQPYVQTHQAVLLANHGVLIWGTDLYAAFDALETVEQTAKIFLAVHQLGGGIPLSPQQVTALKELNGHYQKLAGKRTHKEESFNGSL